jgi:hypothetical protein
MVRKMSEFSVLYMIKLEGSNIPTAIYDNEEDANSDIEFYCDDSDYYVESYTLSTKLKSDSNKIWLILFKRDSVYTNHFLTYEPCAVDISVILSKKFDKPSDVVGLYEYTLNHTPTDFTNEKQYIELPIPKTLKSIYCLTNTKHFTYPWAYFTEEKDAQLCIDMDHPIYGPYIGSDAFVVTKIPFSDDEMDLCNWRRVESVYLIVETGQYGGELKFARHFLSDEKAAKCYDSRLRHLSMGRVLKFLRAPVYNHFIKEKAKYVTIKEFNPDFTEGNRVAMDEKKLYISSFVKDLNFNLAKILTLKSILPDSDRVDYEFGTIEVTTDSPVIEFRFTLDKVEETEAEFKERCFNKMRDLLIQRTKGKL